MEKENNTLFKNILLRYKIHKKTKKWLKLAKKSKQRQYLIKQWKQTEVVYLQKLQELKEKVRNPLLQHNLISQIEELVIFPNLDSMIQLAQEMINQMDALCEAWNPIHTRLTPTVKKLVPFLRLYKDFSQNYLKADAIIQQLKKTKQFQKYVTVGSVEDLLSRPFQRPLKYKLFITSYLKQMPKYHYDYKDLEQALQILKKIADSINQHLEAELHRQKLLKLEQIFGGIIEDSSSRVYISEFIAKHIDIPCKVYVFNDLLFVSSMANDKKEVQYAKINLSETSYVIQKKSIINYQNTIFVCGSTDNIHLTFNCPTDMDSALDILSKTIEDLYQKFYRRKQMISQFTSNFKNRTVKKKNQFEWKQLFEYNMNLRIECVGMTIRMYPPENQVIIFILKIQIGKPFEYSQLGFYELHELKQIVSDFEKLYPKSLVPKIQKFKNAGFEEFKTDMTTFYDHKSIEIQTAINYILRSKPVRTKPQLFLYKLRIHESIWQYIIKNNDECMCDACLDSHIFTDLSFYDKERAAIISERHKFCVIKAYQAQKTLNECITPELMQKCSLEMKMVWAYCHSKKIEENFHQPYAFGQKIILKVIVNEINDEVPVMIWISSESTVKRVIDEVCRKKGIKTTRDLRLSFFYQNKNFYLQNEEYISGIAKYLDNVDIQDQQQESRRHHFFSSFRKTSLSLKQDDPPKLYLRKAFVFPSNLQQKACEQNKERYPLVLGQILYRFKHELLPLNVGDIKILSAFCYSIQQFTTLSMSNNIYINQQKLRSMFPASKKNYISQNFANQLKEIIQNQMQVCEKVTYLYRCVLRHVGQKSGWTNQFFKVINMHPNTILGGHMDLLLGISSNKVIITKYNIVVVLLQFDIIDFNYSGCGNKLFIETQNKKLQFYCANLNLLETVIETYKTIAEHESKRQ